MHPNKKTFANKSSPVVRDYINDIVNKENLDGVHIARVLKKLGDGRVEVVYCVGERGVISQVIIPGRFRGRAKHSSFVDMNSFLLISETGVSGPASLEMIALIDETELEKIKAVVNIDKRVLSVETDRDAVAAGKTNDIGYEFDRTAQVDEVQKELVIDDI
jgi:hypothetical protein